MGKSVARYAGPVKMELVVAEFDDRGRPHVVPRRVDPGDIGFSQNNAGVLPVVQVNRGPDMVVDVSDAACTDRVLGGVEIHDPVFDNR
jgi:hypothetical protein